MLVLLCGLLVGSDAGFAQFPHFDPPLRHDPGDSTSRRAVRMSWDRFSDEHTDWVCNRLGFTGVMPAGERGIFFVRFKYVSFDCADLFVLERWPTLRGEDAVAPEDPGEYDWPYERRVVGYGRPDLGVVGHLRLPLVDELQYGLAAGLPIGDDRLYPFAAADIPLQVELRKLLRLRPGWQLTILGASIHDLDSGRAYLHPDAFPTGKRIGASVTWQPAPRRRLTVGWTDERFGSARSSRLGTRYEIPSGSRSSFSLAVEREIVGTVDRPAATYVRCRWSLRSG